MLSFNEEKFVCATSNILTTKKDQITRGDRERLTRRMQSLLLENLVLGKKSNQQTKKMRIKANYKPKVNDKGKENKAVFRNLAEFIKKLNKIPTCRTSHVLGNILDGPPNHSKFQSDNKKPREI